MTESSAQLEQALIYCPHCGKDFHSTELARERESVRALAALRDKQAEQIQMLAEGGRLVHAD